MERYRVYPTGVGYVVTEKGKDDRRMHEPCSCSPKWAGLWLVCPSCGTCYAYARDRWMWQ